MARKLTQATARKRAAQNAPAPEPDAPPLAPGSNVTDATIAKHIAKATRLYEVAQGKKAEYDSANNAYRASLKDAKAEGVEELAWLMKARKLEPDDIDRQTRMRNRLARVAKLPIGTQLGIFDEAPGAAGGNGKPVERKTVAGAVDSMELLDQTYQAGKVAAGLDKHKNPHPPEAGEVRDAWQRGHDDMLAAQAQQAAAKAPATDATKH